MILGLVRPSNVAKQLEASGMYYYLTASTYAVVTRKRGYKVKAEHVQCMCSLQYFSGEIHGNMNYNHFLVSIYVKSLLGSLLCMLNVCDCSSARSHKVLVSNFTYQQDIYFFYAGHCV